ncbi:MAG TPA: tetratricopeptide repeat protein [Gemmatimonadales bacterium]|nr:tetratricopeptide repeat protein [Gemmatimonadales bacterium]
MSARARLLAGLLALGGAAAGCATQGSVRQVQDQLDLLRAESARRDSVQAARLGELLAVQQQVMDSLASTRNQLRSFGNDFYNVQQQLVQIQELTGQSQRRLSDLRAQLEARSEQLNAQAPAPSGAGNAPGADSSRRAGPVTGAGAAGPSADQMYDASLQQLRRGSTGTARAGLRAMLQQYPASERAPDALFFIGESFQGENADSAGAYYTQVVTNYPQSPRASTALYKLGLLAERRKDVAAARDAYNRVVQSYPKSDEAALARDRLKALGR